MIFLILLFVIITLSFIFIEADPIVAFFSTVVSILISAIISWALVEVIGIGVTKTEVSYQYELVPMSVESKELIVTEKDKSYNVSFTYCDSFGIYRSVNKSFVSNDDFNVHFIDVDDGYAVIYKTTKTVNPTIGLYTFPFYESNESFSSYKYEVFVNPSNIIKEEEIR